MYGLMLDHVKGYVIIMDGNMPAIYESMKIFKTKAYE